MPYILAFSFLFTFVLSGCGSVSVGTPIRTDLNDHIRFNETTQDEVRSLVGSPQSISITRTASSQEENWSYTYASGNPYGNFETDILTITFTEAGRVIQTTRTKPSASP